MCRRVVRSSTGRATTGYKDHLGVDYKNKLIRQCKVSDASVHDSQLLEDFINLQNSGADVWVDSAYRSEETEAVLKAAGYRSQIHYEGSRNKALAGQQQKRNRKRSKVRVPVEHIFGFQQNSIVYTKGNGAIENSDFSKCPIFVLVQMLRITVVCPLCPESFA
jgi:IS5 family transposase